MTPRPLLVLAGLAGATVLTLSGCGSGSAETAADGDAKLDVVAAFYPLQFATERVGADRVAVTNLVQPGAEPHDLELSPSQVGQIGDADLVTYLTGFQPAVDEAVAQNAKDKALDVATVEALADGYVPIEEGVAAEDEKGKDPHVWLDPVRYAAIAEAVAARLGDLDPDHADQYTERAKTLRTELDKLDEEYRSGLSQCERRTFVVSHNAFGYLATRYDLAQLPITGLTPEEEPSPQRLAEIAKEAKAAGVTVIFFEELVSPDIAKTLADEVGARAEVLSPIEGVSDGQDYFSVMRTNLTALQGALNCS